MTHSIDEATRGVERSWSGVLAWAETEQRLSLWEFETKLWFLMLALGGAVVGLFLARQPARPSAVFLHGHVVPATRLAHVEDLVDAAVAHLDDEAGLVDEALDVPGVLREVVAQRLDDAHLLDARRRRGLGDADLAHPPIGDPPQEQIAPEPARERQVAPVCSGGGTMGGAPVSPNSLILHWMIYLLSRRTMQHNAYLLAALLAGSAAHADKAKGSWAWCRTARTSSPDGAGLVGWRWPTPIDHVRPDAVARSFR